MSETEIHEEEAAAPVSSSNGHEQTPQANLLSKIRQLREEAKGDHHLDLPIPGLKDYVWARFRPFPAEKTERKMAEFQRLQGKAPVILKAACDTLIDACEQILLLPEQFGGDIGPEGENLIPIDPDATPPIGFDSRLAEVFNFEASSARQVVVGMFPTEQAIIGMNIRVSEWMQDVTKNVDGSLMGES